MYTPNDNQTNNYEQKVQYLPRFKKLWNGFTIVGAIMVFDAAATLGCVDVSTYGALSSDKYTDRAKQEISVLSKMVRQGSGLEAILGFGFVVGGLALTKKKKEDNSTPQ